MQRRILLLGSAGYLGKTLTTYLQSRSSVIPSHRRQAYFAHSQCYDFWVDNIQSLIQMHQIDTVMIAANMTYEAVRLSYEQSFFKQRVESLIRECHRCRVIYISSDGLFDGRKGNYSENDIPTPTTPYGQNLCYFEEQVQSHCPNYCIVRPSYLYGYSLSQLDPRLTHVREQLLAGKQLAFFTDMIKSPMDVNQVAEGITLLTHSEYVGIVHIAGEAMGVYSFYREAMSSLDIVTEHLTPIQIPTDFAHPRDTSLDITLMKHLTKFDPLPIRIALQRKR